MSIATHSGFSATDDTGRLPGILRSAGSGRPARTFPAVVANVATAGGSVLFFASFERGVSHSVVAPVNDVPGCALGPVRLPEPVASAAVAVGHCLTNACKLGRARPARVRPPLFCPYAVTVAVGHNPDSVASMRRSDRPSAHHERPCGVSKRLQLRQYPVNSSRFKANHILNEYPTGSNVGDKSVELAPQTGTCSAKSAALSRKADVLTREPATQELDPSSIAISGKRSNVLMDRNAGPVRRKHEPTIRVDLAKADRAHSRTFEPERESTDTREEI